MNCWSMSNLSHLGIMLLVGPMDLRTVQLEGLNKKQYEVQRKLHHSDVPVLVPKSDT